MDRTGRSFEHGLGHVVLVPSINDFSMEIQPALLDKGLEELLNELRL
jgi:hypothetical protein